MPGVAPKFWDTTERQAVDSLCYNSGGVCEATERSRVKKPHDVWMFSMGPSQSLSPPFPCSVGGREAGEVTWKGFLPLCLSFSLASGKHDWGSEGVGMKLV